MTHSNTDRASLAFEQLLTDLSAELIGTTVENLADCLSGALGSLGLFLDVDRVILSEFADRASGLRVSCTWARPGIQPIPVDTVWACEIPHILARIRQGKVFRMESVDDLPASAEIDRQQFARSGAKSHLSVPFAVGGNLLGALSFASLREKRSWPDSLVTRLQLIAEAFANAIARHRNERRLHDALHEISELNRRLKMENRILRDQAHGQRATEFIGQSDATKIVLNQVQQVAPTDATVLLLGETGTGKELIARAIHQQSARSQQPLITVNCSALPSDLIESELFGHEAGAFTGALKTRTGRFEVADGGTIFLDEIGELPLELQSKLLRVLQQGEFNRLGSTQTTQVDVRIVAATNRELEVAVRQGEFRSDLYYRLHVFPIRIPPLRERRVDIPLLVWAFLQKSQATMGRRIEEIPDVCLKLLMNYDWPGNVRELENVIERAVILANGPKLDVDDLSIQRSVDATAGETADELVGIERAHIIMVLRKCGWKVKGVGNAADRLGLNPSTLRARMAKLGITRPDRPAT